mmetsp:Transcript_24588/g.40011  ORF Transcript_24588/g.40011 Transcript_24588/m.40011 type:complete len:258 (+) Transcript_24588:563-1336(+)
MRKHRHRHDGGLCSTAGHPQCSVSSLACDTEKPLRVLLSLRSKPAIFGFQLCLKSRRAAVCHVRLVFHRRGHNFALPRISHAVLLLHEASGIELGLLQDHLSHRKVPSVRLHHNVQHWFGTIYVLSSSEWSPKHLEVSSHFLWQRRPWDDATLWDSGTRPKPYPLHPLLLGQLEGSKMVLGITRQDSRHWILHWQLPPILMVVWLGPFGQGTSVVLTCRFGSQRARHPTCLDALCFVGVFWLATLVLTMESSNLEPG